MASSRKASARVRRSRRTPYRRGCRQRVRFPLETQYDIERLAGGPSKMDDVGGNQRVCLEISDKRMVPQLNVPAIPHIRPETCAVYWPVTEPAPRPHSRCNPSPERTDQPA